MARGGFEGWAVTAGLAAVAGAASGIAVAAAGTGPAGIDAGLAVTAATSVSFFVLAFVASAAVALWPGPRSKWLLRNRKHIGLGFAASHALHAGFIAWLGVAHAGLFRDTVSLSSAVGGGVGYAFIAAMTVTSFDGPKKALGGARWKQLHKSGMYVLFAIFLVSYGPRIAVHPVYALPTATLLGAWGVRVSAHSKRRARRGLRAAS